MEPSPPETARQLQAAPTLNTPIRSAPSQTGIQCTEYESTKGNNTAANQRATADVMRLISRAATAEIRATNTDTEMRDRDWKNACTSNENSARALKARLTTETSPFAVNRVSTQLKCAFSA